MKTKRSQATDISMSVKQRVWERDGGRCVVCGCSTAMPNAHYIPRSKGGLGIEENIVTLCTSMTPNHCHERFDKGTQKEREQLRKIIKNYLKSQYKDWNEEKLIYKKWSN